MLRPARARLLATTKIPSSLQAIGRPSAPSVALLLLSSASLHLFKLLPPSFLFQLLLARLRTVSILYFCLPAANPRSPPVPRLLAVSRPGSWESRARVAHHQQQQQRYLVIAPSVSTFVIRRCRHGTASRLPRFTPSTPARHPHRTAIPRSFRPCCRTAATAYLSFNSRFVPSSPCQPRILAIPLSRPMLRAAPTA